MKISDFVIMTVFGVFVLAVSCAVVYLIGQEAIKHRIVELSDDVTTEQKMTAVEVAKKAAQTYKLSYDSSWHTLELIHHEWEVQDSALEIRYYAHEKEPTRFFVIVRPMETIAGIAVGLAKESMVLGLGGPTETLAPSRDFEPGTKIISGFGVIHTLSEGLGGMLNVNPPITEAEIQRNLLLVEHPKATIDTFEIERPNNK